MPRSSTPRTYVLRARLAASTALTALVLALLTVAPAHAAGGPIMIDDFAGHQLGTRTVSTLPAPNTSTTAPATFTEAGGVGTLVGGGDGNAASGVQLDYTLSDVDLTDGGNNTQFLLEFVSILRLPVTEPGQLAASVGITVTSTNNVTGSFSTGMVNMPAGDSSQNIVLNMACSGGGVCFSPQPNFAHVKHITVSLMYPQNHDSTRSLTLKVEQIRTTPTGGAVPPAPVVDVAAPTPSPYYAVSGATLTFPVTVTPGSSTTTINTPLTAGGVTVTGTATGLGNVAVTGSGTSYSVKVGPLTGSGTVSVAVKNGAVVDSWGQGNAPASASTTYALVVPPVFTSGAPASAVVGTTYSHTFAAGTSGPTTYSVSGGSLPSGLTLSAGGQLTGTPTAGGTAAFTVKATNLAGSATQDVTLDVRVPPTVTGAATVSGLVGSALDQTYTLGGLPTPSATATGLPPGVSAVMIGGDLHLKGTPTASGSFTATITATSFTTVTKTVTWSIDEVPTFTSAGSSTATVGTPYSFTVTTSGRPTPTVSRAPSPALPTGLTFTAQPAGTALVAGTPAVGTGGVYQLALSAQSSAGTQAQPFTLTVNEAPGFSGPSTVTLTRGAVASTVIATTGYPRPVVVALDPLPAGLLATDNGDGTLTLSGTPTMTGTSTVRLQATNGIGLPAVVAYTVSVTQSPAFTSGDAAAATVGTSGSISVTTSGFPTPAVTYTGTLPAGVSFASTNGTATLSGTPAVGSGGVYPVHLVASSSAGSASQTLTLTVAEAPRVLSAASASAQTGQARVISLAATGYPAPQLTLGGTLPAGLTFTAGTSAATIAGTPAAGTGGTYTLDLVASSTSGTVHQQLVLTVEQPAAITSAASLTALRGTAGSFTVTTSGFPIAATITSSTLPGGLTLTDNHDGTATIAGTPTVSGTFGATVSADNGVGSPGTQALTLVIDERPSFTSTDHATVTTGQGVSLSIDGAGYPAPALTTTSTLPAGLTFTAGPAGHATITGTPGPQSGGTYSIVLSASNGVGAAVTQTFTLTVQQPSAITSAATASLSTGAVADVEITATGYPLPAITATSALPSGLTLTDHGDGTATLTGTPTVSGVRTVTISANNQVGAPATQTLTLTIADAPIITSAATATLRTGQPGTTTLTATGYPLPTLSTTSTLPTGLTFTPGLDGTATITGTPGPAAGGVYTLDVLATSTSGTTHQTLTLTVNQATTITSDDSATVETHHVASVTLTATGYPVPTLSTISALPDGLAFTAGPDGTATITGTPEESGVFLLSIVATNGIGAPATQSFTLTVDDAPAITSAATATVVTETAVTIPITATGFPLPTVTTTSTLPDGLSLVTDPDGTTIVGTPASDAGGEYLIDLVATSPLGTVHQTFTLTVQQPVVVLNPSWTSVHVGTPVTLTVVATGFPAPAVTTTSALPDGLTLVDGGDGTATISGTPAAGSGGAYTIELTGTNALGSTTRSVTLVDYEDSRFTSVSHATFTVGEAGSFDVVTSGYPALPLVGTGTLPTGLSFEDSGDGTGTLSGTPRAGAAGTYTFVVSTDSVGHGVTAGGLTSGSQVPALAAASLPTTSQTITVTVAAAEVATAPVTPTPKPSGSPSTSATSSPAPSGGTDGGTPLASTGATLAPLVVGLLLLLTGAALLVGRRRLVRR